MISLRTKGEHTIDKGKFVDGDKKTAFEAQRSQSMVWFKVSERLKISAMKISGMKCWLVVINYLQNRFKVIKV